MAQVHKFNPGPPPVQARRHRPWLNIALGVGIGTLVLLWFAGFRSETGGEAQRIATQTAQREQRRSREDRAIEKLEASLTQYRFKVTTRTVSPNPGGSETVHGDARARDAELGRERAAWYLIDLNADGTEHVEYGWAGE